MLFIKYIGLYVLSTHARNCVGGTGGCMLDLLLLHRTKFNILSQIITAIECGQMLKYLCIQAKTCVNINICEYDTHTCIYMYGI